MDRLKIQEEIIKKVEIELKKYIDKYNRKPNTVVMPYYMYSFLRSEHIKMFGGIGEKSTILGLNIIIREENDAEIECMTIYNEF